MLTKYLALISETQQVGYTEVSQIAAALQKQITRIHVESADFLSKGSAKSWRETIDSLTIQPTKKLSLEHPLTGVDLSQSLLTTSFKRTSNGWAMRLKEDIQSIVNNSR